MPPSAGALALPWCWHNESEDNPSWLYMEPKVSSAPSLWIPHMYVLLEDPLHSPAFFLLPTFPCQYAELIYLNSWCTFPFWKWVLAGVWLGVLLLYWKEKKIHALLRKSKLRIRALSTEHTILECQRNKLGLPRPGAGGDARAPPPLIMLEISFSSLRFSAQEPESHSSSPFNSDIGFSGWYWPLLLWGHLFP